MSWTLEGRERVHSLAWHWPWTLGFSPSALCEARKKCWKCCGERVLQKICRLVPLTPHPNANTDCITSVWWDPGIDPRRRGHQETWGTQEDMSPVPWSWSLLAWPPAPPARKREDISRLATLLCKRVRGEWTWALPAPAGCPHYGGSSLPQSSPREREPAAQGKSLGFPPSLSQEEPNSLADSWPSACPPPTTDLVRAAGMSSWRVTEGLPGGPHTAS